MKVYTLKRRQVLPADTGEVFSFFQNPENLGRMTPRWLGFQFLTPVPLDAKEGAVIDYAIHLIGLPMRWTTLITKFEPPRTFVDVRLRGPYSFWHHTHFFRQVSGGTEMTDTVNYAMPLGLLGRLLHALVIKQLLARIFGYRSATIETVFEVRANLTNKA
jgi:ligand-binding SRPBCC domain-containing protein